MKSNKIYKEFDLTEYEYKEYRKYLTKSNFFVHSEPYKCSVLYFDGDDGVVLFTSPSEIFDFKGFSTELIDCSYCDVSLKHMSEILEILNDFEIEDIEDET